MKALILENEAVVDYTIRAFLKDNPDLFEKVHSEIFVVHKEIDDLKHLILTYDAIVISTTFYYKDQLEEYIDLFLNPSFPKKLTFYVHNFTGRLNEWRYDRMKSARKINLFQKVKQLIINDHLIFDFYENWWELERDIQDELNQTHRVDENFKRALYQAYKLEYSELHDIFYTSHERYNLNEQLKTFENELAESK